MKISILFLSLLAISTSALADIFVAHQNILYQVPKSPNVMSTSSQTFDQLNFLDLNFDGDVYHLSRSSPATLQGFTMLKKPLKPKLPKLEGCAKYPQEWKRDAKIIAKLETKEISKKLQISLPKEFKDGTPSDEIYKSMIKLGFYIDAKEKLPNRFFSNGDQEIAFVLYDDGLNQRLAILENKAKTDWKKVDDMTLTDQCP